MLLGDNPPFFPGGVGLELLCFNTAYRHGILIVSSYNKVNHILHHGHILTHSDSNR